MTPEYAKSGRFVQFYAPFRAGLVYKVPMKLQTLMVLLAMTSPAAAFELEPVRAAHSLPALGGLRFDGDQVSQQVVGARKSGDATPATANDKWHLGSCTKAMTATVVATFVEGGALRWESTLAELFPHLEAMHPSLKPVTLAQLLGQRSGLGSIRDIADGALWDSLWDEALDPVVGRRRVADAMLTTAPAKTPGMEFFYSNANYVIAGAALERLTGKSWEILIRERLFNPLEMNSCGFGAPGTPGASSPDQPWGHDVDDGVLKPVEPGFFADNPPTVGPAGTVHCSMTDWAKFLRLHVKGFRGEKTALLQPATFVRLHTPLGGQDYTPGGWIRTERDWAGGPVLTHAGSNTLNLAVTWLAPRKNLGVLAVTNRADGQADDGTDAAIGLLLGP